MKKQKMEHNPIPVYILTRTGVGFNDEGIRAVCDLVMDEMEDGKAKDEATGILAFTGKHLLEPETLVMSLKEQPNARVVLSRPDGGITLCTYGPGENGIALIIGILQETNKNSWSALMEAIGEEVE